MPEIVERARIQPGEKVMLLAPFSEVCMHMRIAGKKVVVELIDNSAKEGYNPEWNNHFCAQLWHVDGHIFSAPILTSEAGLLEDEEGFYYYVWDKDTWDKAEAA